MMTKQRKVSREQMALLDDLTEYDLSDEQAVYERLRDLGWPPLGTTLFRKVVALEGEIEDSLADYLHPEFGSLWWTIRDLANWNGKGGYPGYLALVERVAPRFREERR